MREVHPGNIHPILDELEEGGGLPGDGSDGAHDAGEPHLVGGAVHVEVGDKLHLGGCDENMVTVKVWVDWKKVDGKGLRRYLGGLFPGLLLAGRHIHLLQDGLREKGQDVPLHMTSMAVIIMVSNSNSTITERSSFSCSVGQTILCVEVPSSLETARRACQQRRLR